MMATLKLLPEPVAVLNVPAKWPGVATAIVFGLGSFEIVFYPPP